jgi:hypothetical protein
MSNQGSTTYKHPGNVRIHLGLFWVTNFFGNRDQLVLKRADEMLNEHGLALDCWPSRTRTPQATLQFEDRLIEKEDYESLRSQVADILSTAGKSNFLPILFCQFRYTANGLTVSDTAERCWTKPMCLIGATGSGDDVTLLHEVGHAAGMDHDRTSTDPRNRNFMNEAVVRTTMFQWQIVKMVKAFFA